MNKDRETVKRNPVNVDLLHLRISREAGGKVTSGGEEIQRWGPAEIISGKAHIGPDGLAVVMLEVTRASLFPQPHRIVIPTRHWRSSGLRRASCRAARANIAAIRPLETAP